MHFALLTNLGVTLILSLILTVTSLAERVTFSEIHYAPKDDKPEYIEVFNNSGSAVDFACWEFSNGIGYKFPDFSASSPQQTFMCAFERVLVTNVDEQTFRANYTVPGDVKIFGPYAGSLSNAGEALELRDKNGVMVCRVRYNDRGKWPVAADGAGHSLRLINKYLSCSKFDNWAASASPGGTPGAAPAGSEGQRFSNPSVDLASSFPIVIIGDEWKYNDSGNDLGSAWKEPAFDDSSWPSGGGIFGRETSSRIAAMPEPKIQTEWKERIATHYMRKQFEWAGGTGSAFFSMDAILDDGLVIYLNGKEVGRHRMPAGDINYQTNASSVPSSLEAKIEQRIIESDISGMLINGTNILAVEVHNNSPNSSDLVFGSIIRVSGSGGAAIINEVMVGDAGDGFIEFYNSSDAETINLQGYHLSDDLNDLKKFTIVANVSIPASGFTTVGFKETGFSVGGETKIYLSSPDAVTTLDGFEARLGVDGRSVGRKPAGGSDWFVFPDPTPGSANIDSSDLAGLLDLSEIHFDAEGNVDWVELSADSASAIPIEGLSLTSKIDFSDAVPLSGTVSGNSPKSWDVNFSPETTDEIRIYLITSGGTVLAANSFRVREGIESYQSDPPGKEWFRGTGNTKNAANEPVRETNIIINEIMSDPPSDERNGEFIELYNRGNEAVDLSGWEFAEGINFIFPAGTSIEPGAHLVVAANKDWIKLNYGDVSVIGNYENNLANEGELLRLEDSNGNLADEVNYKVGGDWPQWTNGDGSSMELIHPFADNDLPSSWKDSDESQKTSFEEYSFTSIYHHLSVPRLDKELWVHLVGDAHVILKDIQLLRRGNDIMQNAAKRTTNGRGETGWLPQGTHHASYFENGEFHLISDGHGDNRANKAEIQVNSLTRNDELTLKFKARWVKGKPRVIFKTFEDSFVSTYRLPIPNDLGSPGKANGSLRSSAPPALGHLSHSPAVPTSKEPVTVSAKVSGAADSVKLVYRQDSATNDRDWKSLTMNDNGSGADSRAGDGTWSAQILDQGIDNRIVQFYVLAKNGDQEVTLPARAPEIPAMYVVDDAEIDTDVTSYRVVVSAYDLRSMTSGSSAAWEWKFPNLSNHYKKMTLIVDEKEIFYNCEIRSSGSPWHAGSRSSFRQRGKFKMPLEKRLRGLSKFAWDNTPAAEGAANIFNNKVPRYMLYLMGHEVNENEFASMIENGGTPKHSVEFFEPVGNDFLERNFGDDGPQGELYRQDDIFFFDDNYSKDQITSRYWWYAGDDWPGPGRYHSQWLLRSRETDYDYTALINLLKTVKQSNGYTEDEINRLLDARKICMMAAVRGYIGDWDSFTLRRPKNSFFYRGPGDGKFQFFFHDSDLAYQNTGEMIYSGGSEFSAWLRKPYNRRIFRYYLTEILDKYQARGPRVDAWFDCEQAVSSTYNPNQNKYTGWDSGRRNRILSELSNGHTRKLDVDPIANTANDTVTITGEAGYRVWEVAVENHPEGKFSWIDETTWRIEGVSLSTGSNAFRVIALDDDGKPAYGEETDTFTVNKANNAAPAIVLDLNPGSGNVELSGTLVLDASESYDPEGDALSFVWGSLSENVIITTDGPIAVASFSAPGLYELSLVATDQKDQTSTISREISVFGPESFSAFSSVWLDPWIQEHDIEQKDNYSPGAWWSLNESQGKLVIQLPDDKSYPLGLPPGISTAKSYIQLDHTWKYSDTNIDYMSDFSKVDFDDSSWKTGKGMFGKDSGTIPEPGINTPLQSNSAENLVSYYFRTEFEFSDDPVGSDIDIRAVIDDGARFWLNGIEIDRVRLPNGQIEHGTGASSNTASRDEKQSRQVGIYDGTGSLVNGKNVLAVDLHNRNSRSSDYLFAAELDITAQPITEGGNLGGTTHPWLKRDMPPVSNWSLQTDLELFNLQFGEFMAGLMIEIDESENHSRYAFGYQDGTRLAVTKITSSGSAGTVHSVPFSSSDDVVIRMRREGDRLFFERSPGSGIWEIIHHLDLQPNWKSVHGGIFTSTEAVHGLKIGFDYLMLVSPEDSSPSNGDIVVSEVMYNPSEGSDYEFIELYNVGGNPVDLTGFSLPQGKPVNEFIFPESSINVGEYLLVVANRASFLSKYGQELDSQIIGTWSGGKLNNNGEEIVLLDGDGNLVTSFVYDNNNSWPTQPDEGGYSLVLSNPLLGNTSDGSLWTSSSGVGGSPGKTETINEAFAAWMENRGETNPLVVKSGDLFNNLLTYAFGIDLISENPQGGIPSLEIVELEGRQYFALEYRQRKDASGIVFIVETSAALIGWSQDQNSTVEISRVSDGVGAERVILRSREPINNTDVRFLRLRVLSP